MLVNQTWQPLGGTRRAEIYPYLRKPDLLSSNSCLIRTAEQVILIDAGALVAQTADLNHVLTECHQERPRPVVIYLTHCHIDHSLQLTSHRQNWTSACVWICVHEAGAAYLIEGDREKTIAELYGVPFPSMQPDIRLLTGQDQKTRMSRSVAIAPGVLMTLKTETVTKDKGQTLFKQIVSMGGGEHLEIYPARGHSPDSICIRAGEILFIGDLLAAANPMVAGISGWNRDDLLETLRQVQWLLEHLPIRFCYPGHGGIIPADKTIDIIKRLQHKTSGLSDVTRMNEERLFQITDYALELIDEAEEVFSSIAGRLLYVAYQLERLEEEDAAKRCRTSMNMDGIDGCLLDLRNFCRDLEDGKIRRVEFAHGVLGKVEKIKSLFDPRPLSAILPRSLINRGTGLLLDFIGIANGCRNLEEFIPADLNAIIGEVVKSWQAGPHLDASIIDDAEDYEKYLAALVLRIGHEPVGDKPVLCFTQQQDLPFVRMAAGRFSDTLLNFLEWLGRSRPRSIKIAAGQEGKVLWISVMPERPGDLLFTAYEEKKVHSFQRRFRLCGLRLQQEKGSFILTLGGETDEIQ